MGRLPEISTHSRRRFAQLLCLAPLSCKRSESRSEEFVGLRAKLHKLVEDKEFSGTMLLTRGGFTIYAAARGISNTAGNPIQSQSRFVIGSISKQITAALILRAFEKGALRLDDPIGKFLPEIKQAWAGTVSIHHLLIHPHGIQQIDQPLRFNVGARFEYSQLGYQLLARALEVVHGIPFQALCTGLFAKLKLSETFHPADMERAQLVEGFERRSSGEYHVPQDSLKNYAAAGSMISTAGDLVRWNELLHSGGIVSKEALARMGTRYATRKHPIFQKVEYGYGLLFKALEQGLQIGALGYAPGFASASYYYPKQNMNLVVLSNRVDLSKGFNEAFAVHVTAMQMVKAHQERPSTI